jgi:RND family efflux transporter MFP subunit
MTLSKRLWIPLLIVFVCTIGAFVVVATAPSVEYKAPERTIPTVRTIDAEPQTLRYSVHTQGTVVPRTEADLVPEISGRIVWISPALAPGGFFEEGDPLIRIEQRDFELAVKRQRATVKRAASELEFAAAELARQQGLADAGVASTSQLSDARRTASVAEANLSDARAALEQSERDLGRAEIRAPFEGRVREANVDIGQFVNRGNPAARIYATDYAEIRLPIPDEQLAFLDLPDPRRPDAKPNGDGPVVKLTSTFAGRRHEWTGRIVRTEGEIDARSRMVNVVARVDDPYQLPSETPRPPLAVGLFVEAEIIGGEAREVVVVPRYAMRSDSKILIVNEAGELHTRSVQVLRIDRDQVLIQGPLGPGEQICVSPIQVVVEGMTVRPVSDRAAAETDSSAS